MVSNSAAATGVNLLVDDDGFVGDFGQRGGEEQIILSSYRGCPKDECNVFMKHRCSIVAGGNNGNRSA